MRGPREPFLSGCYVCGKQYLGNAGDPCPRCAGDVDVAAFKRAIDYKALAADLQQQLAARTAELLAMTAARDEARRIGDAALDIELRLHNEQLTKLAAERDADWSAFPWLRKKAK